MCGNYDNVKEPLSMNGYPGPVLFRIANIHRNPGRGLALPMLVDRVKQKSLFGLSVDHCGGSLHSSLLLQHGPSTTSLRCEDVFGHAGHAGGVHGEQHPGPGDENTPISRQSHGVGVACGGGGQGHTTLVGVDGVGGHAHADQGPGGDSAVGHGRDLTAGRDSRGIAPVDGVDDRSGGESRVGVEQVAWSVHLCVVVVGRAGSTETPSAGEDGGIGKQKGGRVIVARDGDGSRLDEVAGGCNPDFGDVDRCRVREGLAVDLTAHDEHVPIGHNDGVGEDPLEPHRVDGLNLWSCTCIAQGNDVGVRGRVGSLVARGPSESQDLSGHRIVHDGITAHGIGISATCTGTVR